VVFSKYNSVPNTKMLTFYRKDTFTLTAAYDSAAQLPNGFPAKISEFTVSNIPPRAADEDGKVEASKIKVKLRLDIHGTMVLESAVAIEEQEVIEEVAPAPAEAAKTEEPTPAAEGAADAAGAAAPETPSETPAADGGAAADGAAAETPSEPAAAATETAEPEKKKSKKVKRVNLTVVPKGSGITPQALMEAQESEAQMALQDRLMAETAEAMNALESAVYSFRDDLSMKLSEFMLESDKEKLSSMLTATEDWLYDEGCDAEKNVYQAKLKEVQDAFAPMVSRATEAEERPGAISDLQAQITRFSTFVADTSEAYAHIKAEDKEKVAAEVKAAEDWLTGTTAKLDGMAKTEDPPVKVADLKAKEQSLSGVCEPIMNTPKPPPPKPEPAPAAADVPAEGAAPAADAEAAEAAPGDAPPAPGPDNMDVD